MLFLCVALKKIIFYVIAINCWKYFRVDAETHSRFGGKLIFIISYWLQKTTNFPCVPFSRLNYFRKRFEDISILILFLWSDFETILRLFWVLLWHNMDFLILIRVLLYVLHFSCCSTCPSVQLSIKWLELVSLYNSSSNN